ncbi:MAG: hypothetical protein BroJett006_27320 [Betaproteobacteria bacterium]|nr:MAG: hypothetical protein BroJett006_27320 [Betaproteobacteria bacterium]
MREQVIKVRVSSEERLALEELARAARLPLSLLVRNAALGLKIEPAPPAAPEVNIEKYGELARLAGNLNQLTRHMNEGHILASDSQRLDLQDVLSRTLINVQHLRRELLGAGQ